MKNYIKTLAISTLTLVAVFSCKKKEAADQLIAPSSAATSSATISDTDMAAAAKSKPLTNLALSESNFEFGKIKKGEHVEHVYEVTNTGTNPLIISAVRPGCGCTVPDYTKDPILPGKKGNVTLKFDSSNFDGLVNKQAQVFANVEKAPITITFSANIQPK